jgi:hypothetical protein
MSGHFPTESMRSTGSPDKHDKHIGAPGACAAWLSIVGSASQLSAAERVRGSGSSVSNDHRRERGFECSVMPDTERRS